ncbi:MAG: hypothetical protein ABDH49_02355 [Candidatus Hydrothermales bacterium]
MILVFYLALGINSEREILRKKFVENLIDIFIKKDTSILDCAHFIRTALLKALSDLKDLRLNVNKKALF